MPNYHLQNNTYNYYLVKYRGLKGDIVKNLATSNLVDKVAEKLGFKCHEVDVGFKNISSTIKKYDAVENLQVD